MAKKGYDKDEEEGSVDESESEKDEFDEDENLEEDKESPDSEFDEW